MPPISGNPSFRTLREASLDAIRTNLIPGVILWAIGLAVVLAYYRLDEAQPFFHWIKETKEARGFLYSGLATALFGGLIPFLYLWTTGRIPPHRVLATATFFVVFWGVKGIEVDALYRLQARIFGDNAEAGTIAAKVAIDQFVYCPFWSAPVTVAAYAWMDADFSFTRLRSSLTFRSFAFGVLCVLFSIWLVWIPATAIIYSLPLPLQIPLFNLVLCFYVLLINALTSTDQAETRRTDSGSPDRS